jgi:hypothetical protein
VRLVLVEIYNDGLMVFLYDESNRGRLEPLGAALVHGEDGAIAKIAADRLLVAYELPEDDPIRVAFSVGKPPGAKEKKGRAWRKPQVTQLALPSGRLCVESLNSLRIDPAQPPAEGSAPSSRCRPATTC